MKKLSRNGKEKVPRISEAEYTAYVTALKNGEKTENDGGRDASTPPKEEKTNGRDLL